MSGNNAVGHFFLVSVCALPAPAVAEVIPNDPDFDLQWGLLNSGQSIDGSPGTAGADIRAPGAWGIHPGTSSVVVAIVGRGVDPHPEFADRLLEGHATVGDPFNSLDTCPHDTHLAGIIAAAGNNGAGIAGINGRARLLPVRVFDGCIGTRVSAAEGIVWAVDHGADVILVPIQFARPNSALGDAIAYAVAGDVVIIAPAGSSGEDGVAYPAAYEGCLAVSATTNNDKLSSISNYGPQVDLAAPGHGIWSTWTDGGYAFQPPGRDTASASAFVTGVAALVRSYAPQISAAVVTQILLDSADDLGEQGRDDFYGAGRVNAERALQAAPAPALRFEHVEPFPTTLPPGARSSFVVRLVGVAESVSERSPVLFSRTPEEMFPPIPLIPVGGDFFAVELPAVACESTLEYFLAADGKGGAVVNDPLGFPNTLYSAYAVYAQRLFEDDFEKDQGWEVDGGDDTSGRWSRVIPVGTLAQPGFDYSPDAGQFCYVTGQHFAGGDGTNDVDGGPVTLTSPVIRLTAPDAKISYARWFVCIGSGKEDVLMVEFSRDAGSSWVHVETVTSTGAWVTHGFLLSDFPEAAGDQLRVRFSTADLTNDSLTEAAIDEFRVTALRCSVTPGDFNHDRFIDDLDYASLLDCWSGPGVPIVDTSCDALDFDHDRRIDLFDYRGFQAAFGDR